jgi:hypothetical protein
MKKSDFHFILIGFALVVALSVVETMRHESMFSRSKTQWSQADTVKTKESFADFVIRMTPPEAICTN